MPNRFTLHGVWLSGPTYKVGLFLSLAGEPFDYVHVDLRAGEHKRPDYVARQRYGQVPLLVDAHNGRHLTQSAAILEYLADTTGRFGGADLDERIAAREWMYWDFDRLARGVYRPRGIRAGFMKAAPEVLEHYTAEGRAALASLDEHLAGRAFLVGEGLTIADIDIYGVTAYAGDAGHDLAETPNVAAWMRRIEALPGFRPATECLPQETRAA
ncbi:glutathione S-transferase family protein [Salinarimonas soli]|uniref:Glutathione S-transferase family protein n=1 Tax=Salinarimonas soli TaxID=1638099 RepID=A0A5B2VA79_9HYPH|nr:glutathione S-transferase family protein [Salinarimonas soli]KAA2235312.1 glutathione S-transferase family protein [Salinarimonas soli]